MFRACHVFLKLQKHCKYKHFARSTRQKCCNLQLFLFGFQKHWYLQCFVHLWSNKYWYLQHFLRFRIAPAKDVKTQKCCNLQHFVTFEKPKIVRKCVKTALFSVFTYPQNGGGALGDAYPDSVQKAFPQQSEGFLVFFGVRRRSDFRCFSGCGVGGSAVWGAPHHRALVALGRSWGKPLVGSRRSRI